MKLRIALLAATVLATPFALHAQPVDGLYIAGGVGANLLQDETIKHVSRTTPTSPTAIGRGTNFQFDIGGVGVGSIGYGLGNGLRFELQGAIYDNKLHKVKGAGLTRRNSSAGGDEVKYGAFINVLYDLPIDSPVIPYVGIGGGYMHNKNNNERITGPGFFSRNNGQNDNIAAQGIAGIAFPLYSAVPGLSLTAEYRFMAEIGGRAYPTQAFANSVGGVSGSSGPREKFSTDDFNHSVLVGFRYAFNTAAPPVIAPIAPQPPQATRTYLVFFDWDRADLTDRARQIVAQAAEASTHTSYTKIEVQGNADLSGTHAYNQRLSLRRAETVAAELVRRGVPRTAIQIEAFGDSRPLVPTAPGVREPQNRRVAIILR